MESLDSKFLTRSDLLMSLTGFLVAFREKTIAFPADIKVMFKQICIRNEDCSVLHFLWAIENDARQFQFTRLVFGATCLPSCAIPV